MEGIDIGLNDGISHTKDTLHFRALSFTFSCSVPVKEDVTFAVTVHFNYSSALRANCKSNSVDSLSIFNESQNARHILLYVNHYLRLL